MLIALGVLIAAHTSKGIHYDGIVSLGLVAGLMSVFNAVIRPILVLFTLPFILLSFGLGLILINALLIKSVGFLVPGFYVESWLSAIWAAIVIGMTSLFVNVILGTKKAQVNVQVNRQAPPNHSKRQRKVADDDVIDI